MKELKRFNNHTEYDSYINSQEKILPNVSLCLNQNEVHYNPYQVKRYITATYNVTDTSSSVRLYYRNQLLTSTVIEKIVVEGVEYDKTHTTHTFDTIGEHNVEFYIEEGFGVLQDYFFKTCTNLKKVKLYNGFTKINQRVFEGCDQLESVKLPNTLTEIARGAFLGCTKLNYITIPSNVTTIGDGAFSGCNFKLENILFKYINPNATFAVDETNKIIYKQADNSLIQTFANTTTIPNYVTAINEYSLYGNNNITNITIPNNVTNIGTSAFQNCTNLTNITIPDSVTLIGTSAFQIVQI